MKAFLGSFDPVLGTAPFPTHRFEQDYPRGAPGGVFGHTCDEINVVMRSLPQECLGFESPPRPELVKVLCLEGDAARSALPKHHRPGLSGFGPFFGFRIRAFM